MARPNEDDNQFGIQSVHVVDDEQIQDGGFQNVVPPGGNLPDLKLAQFPGINVASGQSFQAMPDPPKPDLVWPALSGSPACGGVDLSNSSPPAPNLAGIGGGFDFPADGAIHQPDYAQPDFASLNLALSGGSDDIAQANLNYSYGGEFAPDPFAPDLTDYNKPMGLDFYPESYANLWAPDPTLDGDAANYEVPGGIRVINDPQDPDPQIPDLQNPQFQLAVQMQGRPGDVDPGAMNILSNSPDNDMTKGVSYDLSYMVQPGSSRRSRHMDLLMDGLNK